MATKKVVDKLLPTTMVGSYPRPGWFKHQLLGRDIRVAFKEVQHEEAYTDAVATVIARIETKDRQRITAQLYRRLCAARWSLHAQLVSRPRRL